MYDRRGRDHVLVGRRVHARSPPSLPGRRSLGCRQLTWREDETQLHEATPGLFEMGISVDQLLLVSELVGGQLSQGPDHVGGRTALSRGMNDVVFFGWELDSLQIAQHIRIAFSAG